MNSFQFLFTIILSVFLTFTGSYAKITDYLEGTDRTFNAIEGKVITVRIDMKPKKLEELHQMAQNSLEDYFVKYKTSLSDFDDFESKVNVTFIVDSQEQYFFQKAEFKLGGQFGRLNTKLGYNLKLKKDDSIFGRRTFRIRSDPLDYTHIRSKLATDLMNKWGIPSIQETFARLYINDQFYGLYFFEDAIKPSWILENYDYEEGEDVKTLYYCQSSGSSLTPAGIKKCPNEKEDYANYTEPIETLANEIVNYKSLSQLKKVFDVDNLRKIMISEYLFGAYDNFLIAGHNFHAYQQPNGIWQILVHDYDSIFLADIDLVLLNLHLDYELKSNATEYIDLPFDEWYTPDKLKPFVDLLYYKDYKNFVKVMKEMLITGFNPDELFERIDELYQFIEPYIVEDNTVNEDGILPGQINLIGIPHPYTLEQSRLNKEYTTIDVSFGLKAFIQARFDFICQHYGFNKKHILQEAAVYRRKVKIQRQIRELKAQLIQKTEELKKAIGQRKTQIQNTIKELTKKIQSLFLSL